MFITIQLNKAHCDLSQLQTLRARYHQGKAAGGGREAWRVVTHASDKSRCHYFAKGCGLSESFDTDPVLTNQHYNVFQIFSTKKNKQKRAPF